MARGEPERWILVNGWERHQHRDMARTKVPPWLKVYTRLLSDDDYLQLTLRQRGILLGIWLAYARGRRVLGSSPARLGLLLGDQTVRQRDLEALNHAGFISFSASKPDSNHASKPASLEIEIEIEKNTKAVTSKADAVADGKLEQEKSYELIRIITHLSNVKPTTYAALSPLADQVPLSVLADLRTRCAGKGPGWVVRALQSEIQSRLGAT